MEAQFQATEVIVMGSDMHYRAWVPARAANEKFSDAPAAEP
jgi:hypothetical protein